MGKSARNDPCFCGSGKKYKKCCLNRGVTLPIKKADLKPPRKTILVKTLTEEFFQPIRLYYTIYDTDQLRAHLQKLRCINYDSELNDWTLRYEAEAADIGLKIPPSKVPAKAQPLIIATIYIENGEMLIDCRSIERAARIIEFMDKYIPRHAVKITHAAIYNKLITAPGSHPELVNDVDYDDIFNEQRIVTIDPEKRVSDMKSMAAQYKNKHRAMKVIIQETQESSKKPLPEVEKMPVYYYEEGISLFEMTCRFRQMIAMQHYLGEDDYSFYDLIQELLQKSKNLDLLYD